MYNCGSKDVVQKSVDDIVEQREDFNQEELLKQLHSHSLMRLWRTGASDDYFDVGSHVFNVSSVYLVLDSCMYNTHSSCSDASVCNWS